jgi:hypothetical protein
MRDLLEMQEPCATQSIVCGESSCCHALVQVGCSYVSETAYGVKHFAVVMQLMPVGRLSPPLGHHAGVMVRHLASPIVLDRKGDRKDRAGVARERHRTPELLGEEANELQPEGISLMDIEPFGKAYAGITYGEDTLSG